MKHAVSEHNYNKNNKICDRLPLFHKITIFLIPITAGLGSYVLPINALGYSIFAFRMLVIIAVIAFPFMRKFPWEDSFLLKEYMKFSFLWILWGLISLIFTPDIQEGINELLSISFGSIAIIIIHKLVLNSNEGLIFIRYGWLAAYIACASVAGWEIRTGEHLLSHFTETSYVDNLNGLVMSTFGNPNDYAVFLCMCQLFMLWSLEESVNYLLKIINWLLIISLQVLLIYTSCRSAFIVSIISLCYYFTFCAKSSKTIFVGLVLTSSILILIFGNTIPSNIQDEFISSSKFLDKITDSADEFSDPNQGSGGMRLNLILSGIVFTIRSYGIGVGAGGYEETLTNYNPFLIPLDKSINPHNFWIEIMSQYGLFVFSWLVYIIVKIFVINLKLHKLKSKNIFLLTRLSLIMIVSYIPLMTVSSSSISNQIIWVMLGTILCLSNYSYSKAKVLKYSNIDKFKVRYYI